MNKWFKDTAQSLVLIRDSLPRTPETDLLDDVVRHFESLAKDDEKVAALQAIGESAARCLADMVAALEVDYDRLEELNDMDLGDGKLSHDDAVLRDERIALQEHAGDCTSREDAEQRINEDPLSLQVRNGWHNPGELGEPEEFEILLSTGGPATRIIGELDQHNQPCRARLQAQDWFTQWTDYRGDAISQDQLLAYCSVFYFGE